MKKPGPLQSVPGLSWRLLAAHTGHEIPPRITGTDSTRDKIARSRRYLAGRRGTKRQNYSEANCWLVSTAESISPRSPHWRVSDLFSVLSIEAIRPGARLTRTRAAVVMPVSGSVLSKTIALTAQ